MRLLRIIALLWLCPMVSKANSILEYERQTFISTYVDIAVAEMQRTGVPASITLGQAILESNWGKSSIATDANNFFCIKCYNGWQGPTYSAKDDEVGLSCFRKYESILLSFQDHSDFLKKNERYQPLFQHHVTDYRSWAKSLKDCGYATDARYAQKLTTIIEEYGLWVYDYAMTVNQFSVLNTPYIVEEQPPVTEQYTAPTIEQPVPAPDPMVAPDYRRESIPQATKPAPAAWPATPQPAQQPQSRKIRPVVPEMNIDLDRW